MASPLRKFAVFDIDGTLIRWQLYHAIVDQLAKQGLLGNQAAEAIRIARTKWKHREHTKAFREYEQILITVYEDALQQLDPKAFDEAVKEVVKEYKQQTYRYTRDLVTDLKQAGYVLLAISGSHQEAVEQIASVYGFDDCVGSQYERRGVAFNGKYFLANKDKRSILKNLIKKHQLTLTDSIAIGDSTSDASMLEMVEQPIAFNPDQALFKIAKENQWKVIIERKNMIYTLEPYHGKYLLA